MGNYLDKIVFLIPAYNPNEKLVDYINELLSLGACHIVVVNDGSKIECNQYFEQLKLHKECKVLNHIVNQGKGRALKTGLNYYLDNYDERDFIGIITADSDGQHLAKDTVNVAKKLFENRDKLILGTRSFNGSDVPFKSKYGNKITTQIFKLLYGVKINDTQTGLRGINNRDIRGFLLLNGEKFDYEINMLIMGATGNNETYFEELPIKTIYEDNNSETHFKPISDSIKIYLIMLKKFFAFGASGIASSIVDIVMFTILFSFVFKSHSSMINIFLSTILARVISSTFNFALNKNFVFKSSKDVKKAIVNYWVLCILQMLTSALLVYIIDSFVIFNTVLIKLIVDFILFFISYKIQNELIFKGE